MADKSLELAIIASGIIAAGGTNFGPTEETTNEFLKNPSTKDWRAFDKRLREGSVLTHPGATAIAEVAKLVHAALTK